MNTTLARLTGGLLLASATTLAVASTAAAAEPGPVPPAVTAEPVPVQEAPPQPPREPTVSRVPEALPVTPPPVTRVPEAPPAVPGETRAPQVSPVPVGAPDTGGGATVATVAMTDDGPPVLAGVVTAAGLMGLTVAGAGLVARHRRARR